MYIKTTPPVAKRNGREIWRVQKWQRLPRPEAYSDRVRNWTSRLAGAKVIYAARCGRPRPFRIWLGTGADRASGHAVGGGGQSDPGSRVSRCKWLSGAEEKRAESCEGASEVSGSVDQRAWQRERQSLQGSCRPNPNSLLPSSVGRRCISPAGGARFRFVFVPGLTSLLG